MSTIHITAANATDKSALIDVVNAHFAEYKELMSKYATAASLCKRIAEELEAAYTPEELRKIWFFDYGVANCWNAEECFLHNVAAVLHAHDKAEHPELHKLMPQKQHWNCWHEYNCSCGFCSSCDSSD